jgi:hypothetical protein
MLAHRFSRLSSVLVVTKRTSVLFWKIRALLLQQDVVCSSLSQQWGGYLTFGILDFTVGKYYTDDSAKVKGFSEKG